MNELTEQQESEDHHKRHDGDVCRRRHAGNEDERCRQQSLSVIAPLRRLHRLIRGDEKHQVGRSRNRAARNQRRIDDVEKDIRDAEAAHDRLRDELRAAV